MRFESVSQKQAGIFKFPHTDYDALVCDGAIRTGKTIMMIVSFIEWAMNEFDNTSFGICGKTVRAAERNIILPLMSIQSVTKKFSMKYQRSMSLLTIKWHGKVNYFFVFGGKDESSYALIQGITLAGVLFDEVALMPESFVDQAVARTLSTSNAKIWFNCNPGSPAHWFYTEWIQDLKKHNAMHIHFLLDDNPHLSDKEKERARSSFSGVFYQRYIKGEWVEAEGRIYPMFNNENIYSESERPAGLESNALRYCAVDYGTENPCVFLDIYDDGETIWVDREYYYDGRKKQAVKTNDQYADDFDEFFSERPLLTSVIVDPSAAAFKEQLRQRGYFVKDGNNDVLDGITKTASLIYRKRIRVNESCENLLKEVRGYVWDDKSRQCGEEKPLKVGDHACITGDTVIETENGPQRIDRLVGKSRKVKCFDEKKSAPDLSRFYNVQLTQRNAEIFEVTLENGEKIRVTENHPFYTQRGWVKLKDLTLKDKILKLECVSMPKYSADGNSPLNFVGIKSIRPAGKADVYNMQVEKHHNYCVNGGYVLHNCDAMRYFVNTVIPKYRIVGD